MPPVLRHRNGVLSVDHGPLQANALQETFLTADCSSTTLTVKDINGFAINQYLLIEELGTENAELVKTHASSAPSGTTVTLASSLARTHTAGAKVYIVKYDQIELSHATTTTGSKTVMTTTNILPDAKIQRYNETAYTSGYYFARYKETIGGTFSDYTDPLLFGGWDKNTVGYAIDTALRELKTTLSDTLTRLDCYDWMNKCLNLIKGKQLHWPEHYVFNQIIGQTTAGQYVVTMPTDIYDSESNRSILPNGLRIGGGAPIDYEDPATFDDNMDTQISTTTRSSTSVGATSINLTNSYDFADSGTVEFWVSGTKYSATYTGVTRDTSTGATGALTGVPASGTGSVSVIIPSGTTIWQGVIEGAPVAYTVRNGQIEVRPVIDSTNDNQNIYLDYAKVVTAVDSDGDTIDLTRYDIVQPYLTWRIEQRVRNDGKLDQQSGYYLEYKEALNDAIRTSPRGLSYPMTPRVNTMRKR